jgi:hypothetical protein
LPRFLIAGPGLSQSLGSSPLRMGYSMKHFLGKTKARRSFAGVVALVAALTSAIAIVGSAGSASAASKLTGAYTLTYLSGPSHTASATQCVVFTNNSGIVGFKNSGTWVASTFAGFGGNFVVDGKDLRFYGTYSGGAGVVAHHAAKSGSGYKGGFDDFAVSGPTANNDGNITLTKGCTAVVATHAAHASPTR